MTREEAIETIKKVLPMSKTLEDAFYILHPEFCESKDERIRKEIVDFIQWAEDRGMIRHDYRQAKRPAVWISYLEKQKDASKAVEAVDRIDKYIDEHIANAHDMKDSNPDKKYYRGWDDALGKMAGILQDVYSGKKQKEQKPLSTEETELNSIAFLEQMGYTCIPPEAKQKPILEVFGFKVGDAVRLKDGDGRKHIIKSFEEVEGIHGPNFYHVEFEDNSATDGIYPGEEYPNGYYTQMEKIEEEQNPAEKNITNEEITAWNDKSLTDVVITELGKYNGENYWKSPWAIDSTGLQYPLYFANLGATWQKKQKPILKFKVGDKIHLIDGTSPNYEDDCITIREIDTVNYIGEFKEGYVPIKEQDKWELVKKQKLAEYTDDVVEEAEEYTSKVACGEYGVEVTEAYIAGVLSERNRGIKWSEDIIRKAVKEVGLTQHQIDWFKTNVFSSKQEWSKEDESKLDDIEKAINNYYDLNHAPQYHYWLEQKLKSLRSQPKQEWSEEDEKMLSNIISHLEVAYSPCDWLTKIVAWLKSLSPQIIDSKPLYTIEQVDEKIREVQEKMLGGVYSSYDMAKIYVEGQNNILTNLDKYRPSWKPSEEQMRYLKKVYESYDFCDGERDALESLHNDLIKLGVKEETEYYQHFDPDC